MCRKISCLRSAVLNNSSTSTVGVLLGGVECETRLDGHRPFAVLLVSCWEDIRKPTELTFAVPSVSRLCSNLLPTADSYLRPETSHPSKSAKPQTSNLGQLKPTTPNHLDARHPTVLPPLNNTCRTLPLQKSDKPRL